MVLQEFQKGFREFKIDWFLFREPSVKKTLKIWKLHKEFIESWKTDVEYYKMFLSNVLYNTWFANYNKLRLKKEMNRLTPEQLAVFFSHILSKLGLDLVKEEEGQVKKK